MNNEEMNQRLSESIAAVLPKERVDEIIVSVLTKAFDSIRWSNNEIIQLANKAVIERAQELLKTKYKEDIEQKAERLALNVVSMMGQLVMPRSY